MATQGCDVVFGIRAVPDATRGSDSAILIDARPAFSCIHDAHTAEVCADFDEDVPTAYVLGTPMALAVVGTGPITVATAPVEMAPSQPNVLDVNSIGGGSYQAQFNTSKAFSRFVIDFDMLIDDQSTNFSNFAPLVRISASGTPYPSCYTDVAIDVEPTPLLVIVEQCNGFAETEIGAGLPLGWVHLTFAMDLSFPRATVLVNQTAEYILPLGSGSGPLGSHIGSVLFGIINADFGGLHVQFDNVVVELDPPN